MKKYRRTIYLDYAATTPLAPKVLEAMMPYFGAHFGNAGSLHAFGQEAQAAVDRSRAAIAGIFGCQGDEIIFTGSATESNNLAIRGTVRAFRRLYPDKTPHIITSVIEHESVLETCRDLAAHHEAEVLYIPVTSDGMVNLKGLERALRAETALVTVMHTNNEIGTMQPLPEIANIIQNFRNTKLQAPSTNAKGSNPNYPVTQLLNYPLFHTDAVQAVQFFDPAELREGVDLLTFSGHKLYGPKGIGGLYMRKDIQEFIDPVITGGGQEYGFRSATENVAAIAGFARALELVSRDRENESARIRALRDMLYTGITRVAQGTLLNGSFEKRLPNNLNLSFPGWDAEKLLFLLDQQGIAVSAGSACRAKSSGPSYTVEALGFGKERARSSMRITLGRPTSEDEIRRAVAVFQGLFSTSRP